MQLALRLFCELILGYLLQAFSYVIGMHGIAKQKLNYKKVMIVCVACAAITYVIRTCGLFNFGVHTMLVLLVINAACIIICRMSIRPSILGSILMMILVLLSELVNVAILSIFFGAGQINTLLADPLVKALSAVPGNIVLLLAAIFIYRFKMRGGKKDGSGKQAG